MKEISGRFFQRVNDVAISFSDSCLTIDRREVIRKVDNPFFVHEEKNTPLSGLLNLESESVVVLRERLIKIIGLLNEGKQLQAVLMASLTNWHPYRSDADTRKANFNPAELRQSGKWSGEGAVPDASNSIVHVQYRGYFHDVVVDDLLKGLRTNGSVVLKNVRVFGMNMVMAIPMARLF